MKSLQKLHFFAYLILLVLTLLMAAGTVIAVITGDIGALSGGLAAFVFVVFAIVQVVCLAMYQPGLSVYKVGFYLMHIGLLILLAGLAAYSLAGESITVQVPISETGNYYRYVQNEDGEEIDLGFAFKLDKFTLEKYESGSDKYYRTDVTFADPTTLATEGDYLEVNRTLRRNGWKIYLMSYSDGVSNMQANSLSDYISKVYTAEGDGAGTSIVEQIYTDLEGKWYSYYLYDEINTCFLSVTAEEISTLKNELWAYTFEDDDTVIVYLTQKDGTFAETLTATGSEISAHIAENYADSTVSYYYYTIDMGRITEIDKDYLIGQCTDPVFAGFHDNGSGKVSVYVMKQEMRPTSTFNSAAGGSSLLASVSSVHGSAAQTPQYRIYSPAISDYTATTEEELLAKEGVLNAYAVYMGDTLVIFVHPLSNLLMLKQDPGEYATVTGMVLVMLGGVMMCLIRGRKKEKDGGDDDRAPTSQTPVAETPAKEIPASQTAGGQAPTSGPPESQKRKKAKGGRKR